jgi:hypothetical protein
VLGDSRRKVISWSGLDSTDDIDVRRRDLEFAVGDQLLLKVSPTKGIVRFGATGKLSPRYIGPLMIIARVGSLAYRLQLPESMKGVHNVFHVSMLTKYLPDPEHKIDLKSITVQQDLTLECRPVRILESSECAMRRRTTKYVRVLWTNQTEREATWELEEQMRKKYPELFKDGELYHLYFVFLFFGLYHRSTRIQGRILLRGYNVTPKKIERASGVDRKFDFLNRYSDGRSETADAKISSKRDYFTIHMLDLEVGWITYE